MAVTIEDLRKEDLFLSWEGATVIFSKVIANNGVDADLKLWIQARKYAARIGQSAYNYREENVSNVIVYYPAMDFIRICGEIESDKVHDRWWKMTMRSVLFTMVCTFAFDDYFGKEKEMDGSVKDTEFCTMYDCIDPDFSNFESDEIIYDHVKNIMYDLVRDCSKEDFYRYNVFDEELLKKGEKKVEKIKPKDTKASFEISNKTEYFNLQLTLFYKTLKEKGFVDKDTDQQVFINMFAGKAPAEKIKWTGLIYELHYLFKKLFHLKLIKQHPTSVRKWEAVCSCFQLLKRNRKVGNKRKEYNYEPYDITPTQFNKGGKMPESHEELDNIIALLNPKLDILRALDSLNGARNEIKDEFDDLQVYDKRE